MCLYHLLYTNWYDAQEDKEYLGEEEEEEEQEDDDNVEEDKDDEYDEEEEDEEDEDFLGDDEEEDKHEDEDNVKEDNDEEYDEEEEDEEVEVTSKTVETSVGAALHVVQNHNQQRDNLGSNFIGSTSYLALNYEPPLGPFSEYFVLCTICCI